VFDPVTTNVGHLKGGTLRALAVSTPTRMAAFPNISTFAELGFASLTGSQWLGLSAPKGLPAPIAQRLTALIPNMLVKPDVVARLDELQTLPRKTPVMGDEFVKLIQSQTTAWCHRASKRPRLRSSVCCTKRWKRRAAMCSLAALCGWPHATD